MLSIGDLIFVSIRPLLRLILCVSCGFVITRLDIYPAVAARGVGQVLLNIAYPCLIFSKIVPAFTSQNIAALGPLVLVATLYEAIGIGIAWVVKQFFWVPHRFRYGILVAGGWSNVGDVPTSVLMSICGAAPFNPSTDSTLAVAYIIIFIFVFFVTLFPMGGHKLIQMDYVGPEVDDEELRKPIPAKAKESLQAWLKTFSTVSKVIRRMKPKKETYDIENASCNSDAETTDLKLNNTKTQKDEGGEPETSRRVSFLPEEKTVVPTEASASRIASPLHTEMGTSRGPSPSPSQTNTAENAANEYFQSSAAPPAIASNEKVRQSVGPSTPKTSRSRSFLHCVLVHIRSFLLSLWTPQSMTIFIAFPCALVTPLKALFTPVANSPIPNAPDGQPPLAFLLDTTSFIGAAAVPMGLISLGSALARLKIPRSQWGRMPIGAISALALLKMILMPILGILIEEGLVHAGVIAADDKVLRFVCIFLSCIPTATTQVFLTQVYSGTGSAETLSAFLIPQYALFLFTMTILSAYSLSLIF